MTGDPYSRILELVRPSGDGLNLKLRFGSVTQNVPLKVRTAGIEMPTELLRVNGHAHSFDVGDQVLMLTEDDQIFYILMKVVKAE